MQILQAINIPVAFPYRAYRNRPYHAYCVVSRCYPLSLSCI